MSTDAEIKAILVSEGIDVVKLRMTTKGGESYWNEKREHLQALIDAKALTKTELLRISWKKYFLIELQ